MKSRECQDAHAVYAGLEVEATSGDFIKCALIKVNLYLKHAFIFRSRGGGILVKLLMRIVKFPLQSNALSSSKMRR